MADKDNAGWTFADLAVCYHTGHAQLVRKEGRRNIRALHEGILTTVGEFEIPVWRQLIEELIERHGEQELQQQLLSWEREHNYSNQTETQLKQKALELHAGRIFDDREWVSYIPFHQRFRPQELEKAVLMWIETECCKRPGQVTKEQREKAVRMNERIICPHCGRLSGYRLCVPEKTE